MSFGFDPTPPEKIIKSWRDDQVGECWFASVQEPSWGHRGLLATSLICEVTPCPHRHLCAGEAGYNCLLALSVPL